MLFLQQIWTRQVKVFRLEKSSVWTNLRIFAILPTTFNTIKNHGTLGGRLKHQFRGFCKVGTLSESGNFFIVLSLNFLCSPEGVLILFYLVYNMNDLLFYNLLNMIYSHVVQVRPSPSLRTLSQEFLWIRCKFPHYSDNHCATDDTQMTLQLSYSKYQSLHNIF